MAEDFRDRFSVEIDRYLGLWHELARTPNSFQDNHPRRDGERYSECLATTAEYAAAGPGELRITNRCIRRAPSGAQFTDTAHGVATVQDGSGNRKLRVAFGPGVARFFQRLMGGGGYWIYCLGPVNADGRYAWAVVSGPKRDFLYFLARESTVSDAVMREMKACATAESLPVEALTYRQE